MIDGSWPYTPFSDSDGSGQCYLTQNQLGNTDVDNGSVTLISPTLDMSGENDSIIFDYYLYLSDSQTTDLLRVEIDSNNGAGPWTTIATDYTSGGRNWRTMKIYSSQIRDAGVTLTSTMRLRFTVNDSAPQGVVEAGIDAVGTFDVDCLIPVTCPKGDVTDDGSVNGSHIQPFMDDNGTVDVATDADMMVDCLVNGVCP